MRRFHLLRNQLWKPSVNLDKVNTTIYTPVFSQTIGEYSSLLQRQIYCIPYPSSNNDSKI